MVFNLPLASAADTAPWLLGIGFREQELQVAKGANFAADAPSGIAYASFAGGTHIFIKGTGFASSAQANQIRMDYTASDGTTSTLVAPALTEDDAFNSNPEAGLLAYRIPSVATLLQTPEHQLDHIQSVTVELSVAFTSSSAAATVLESRCQSSQTSLCKIHYQRRYTPVVFTVNPPVVYYGSKCSLLIDAKGVPGLITALKSDELPFVNAKIGGSLLDFEETVDSERTFTWAHRDSVIGQVGELPIGRDKPVLMQWETGWAHVHPTESVHCSYDMSDCYTVRALPMIQTLSSHSGYLTGMQEITVTGYGFDSANIVAKVGDTACVVTSYSMEQFTCRMQPNATATPPLNESLSYVGQHGVRMQQISGNQTWVYLSTYSQNDSDWVKNESLALNMEGLQDKAERYVTVRKAWFIAPATTNYRFLMACDDGCKLKFDQTAGRLGSETEILSASYSPYRSYHYKSATQTRVSAWIPLVQGEAYYIQAEHVEYTSGDHLTVGVEIEQTAIPNHHHSRKEVQKLAVKTEDNRDTTTVTLSSIASSGAYLLLFRAPAASISETIASSTIQTDATASQFKSAVRDYYRQTYGSNIDVIKEMLTSAGAVTTNSSEATQYRYTITMSKLITGPSVADILLAKMSGNF